MNVMGMRGIEEEGLARLPRRRILHLLGGASGMSGVLGLAHDPAAARRKKKKCRRPCNSEETCKRGKCVPIARP